MSHPPPRFTGLLAVLWLSCGSIALAATDGEESGGAAPEIESQPARAAASRTPEPAALQALQGRLDSLSSAVDSTACSAVYTANKAQAWLNFSKYAAAEQLPAADRAAALRNAQTLLESLERHEATVGETPELPAARHVRDDLWQAVAAVKRDGRWCAAPKMTAYCEVELAWVDYEAGAGGRRHVDPYVRIAEDYCSSAIAAQPMPSTSPQAAREFLAPAAAPQGPAATASSAPSAPSTEAAAKLAVTVMFPHNRARRADIRAAGRAQLRQLARRLKSLPRGTSLLLVGHADLTGHPDYNLRLSEQRARSVLRELRALGVHGISIKITAVGSSQPLLQCPSYDPVADRRRYLDCLEPNRRVVVEVLPPLP
jgi:outer membrane protein OmpA-like peptidoglycan-associated protein